MIPAVVFLLWALAYWPVMVGSFYLLSRIPGLSSVVGEPIFALVILAVLMIVWIVGLFMTGARYEEAFKTEREAREPS